MAPTPTAAFLKLAIANSDLTQREIAQQAELPKPNVLSMMKTGETNVPLNRILALTEACGVDAATFIRIAMTEYHQEIWRVLEAEFGANLTEDEEKLVEGWRYLACQHQSRLPPSEAVACLDYRRAIPASRLLPV
ncbi:MAG: helix-turn-helix domain-containing protein [Limimaricola soesokkakensis]|uniref:helix-turn-helix domain-containing protein n=1 Tax=Limimaricola soesokkakensis TaxID=1343159 RepID=UPI004057F2F3